MVLRKLEYPRTPEFRDELEAFAQSMVGIEYEESFGQLLSSIVSSQTMRDRERLEVLCKTARTQLGEVQYQLSGTGSHGVESGLAHRSLHKEQ